MVQKYFRFFEVLKSGLSMGDRARRMVGKGGQFRSRTRPSKRCLVYRPTSQQGYGKLEIDLAVFPGGSATVLTLTIDQWTIFNS